MEKRSQFLDRAEANLKRRGLRTTRDAVLADGRPADLVGSRTYMSWKGLVLLSQHVVIRTLESATPSDLESLFETGFRYGKRVNRVPLLRGLQFGYMVVPCVVLENAEEAVIRYAERCPRKHWALFEYPVVVDLGSKTVHFYQQTPTWGAFFFSDLRQLVQDDIYSAVRAA